jgi:hypothetical protein
VKRADLIINILIYFSMRGYVSDAAFMKSRGGASHCPISAPGSRPQHRDAPEIQPGEERWKSTGSMRAEVSAKKKL